MKSFDIWANIIAGLLVWLLVTGVLYFFLSWGSDDPLTPPPPFWPRMILIVVSVATFSLYVRRFLKRLDR